MTKPREPRQRARTEFRVPPPLLQRTGTGFSGLDLLESETGVARLVFWSAYRDVELWVRATERDSLFRPEQADPRFHQLNELDPDTYGTVSPHIAVLIELIRSQTAVDPASICSACSAIASWFEERGRLRCAVDYAIAAYLTVPQSAALAVRTARLLRMLAEYPRSTSWFDYAIYLARKSRDWQAYSEALAGLGNLYFQTGNFPRARHFHRRCLRLASREHLAEMQGAAYHNLFVLEMDAGDIELAEELASKALSAYPPISPCRVRLARDLSRRWTVLGHFEQALPLALETLEHFSAPIDRALVWADVARSAGGCGELAHFEDAWVEAWALVRRRVADPVSADVLIDLARGAASMGDTRRAAHAAARALEIARERNEGRTVLEAEALLDSVHAVAVQPRHPATERTLPELAQRMLQALRELRATAA
jgi:tetratricopeptide (TPR) repeat protein